jgi:hypothetical protein
MANHEITKLVAVRELSRDEMEQTHGGAWYAKFDGVDGSLRSSKAERPAPAFVGGWGSSMYQYSF